MVGRYSIERRLSSKMKVIETETAPISESTEKWEFHRKLRAPQCAFSFFAVQSFLNPPGYEQTDQT